VADEITKPEQHVLTDTRVQLVVLDAATTLFFRLLSPAVKIYVEPKRLLG